MSSISEIYRVRQRAIEYAIKHNCIDVKHLLQKYIKKN